MISSQRRLLVFSKLLFNNMKKLFLSILFAFFTFDFFAAESDVYIFNELSSAYSSGFYPGAVQYADRLCAEFPDSAYVGSALALKGECLAHLGNFDDAYDVLCAAEKLDSDSELKKSSKYWLAKVFDYKKNYPEALRLYHEYCVSSGRKGKYFPAAVFDSGVVFYKTSDFKNAAANFEYVLKNGEEYSDSDYYSALLKLADSYNNSGNAKKTLSLYSKAEKQKMPSAVFYALSEYAGDACGKLKNYKQAYEFYCEVLKSGEKSLAANALKKAYKVSSEHKKEVGLEPGSVLQEAQKNLSDSPELLAEFWARLGTDAYFEGDFKKASEYFDEAEKYSDSEIREFIAMYRAEITAGKNITKNSAEKAKNQLAEAQKIQAEMENPKYLRDYNSLLAKYSAYSGNWNDVKKYAPLGNPENERTKFYLALANYKTGDYSAAENLMESAKPGLYALSLARGQKLKEAASVYHSFELNGKITPQERLDYSKVLILSGRYKESQIQAAKSGLNEGKYILGLAQFNTRSWPYAEKSFAEFIKNADRKDSGQAMEISYAMFYQGYSQYRQGKTKEAFSNLSSFVNDYPSHELLWNAQMTAAKAAVQMEKYSDAAKMAEKAVESAKTTENKEESVLLLAEIFTDSAEFGKAVEILSPYSAQKTDFGMKSLYQLGQIYEKKKDFALADQKYLEVFNKFQGKELAEEAFYRRGEIFYGIQDFKSALERFSEYKNKCRNGKFTEAAWYYTADCMEKTGNSSGAILQNQALIKKFPESTYVYNSAKNLVSLYRTEGKYSDALENANFLLEKYGSQAKADGIPEIAAQLKKLASGKNEATVQKETEYRNAGGNSTPEGRKAGTELALLYAENSDTTFDAVRLSEQILPLQEKNNKNGSESLYIAQNAEILGNAYKIQQKNKQSAEMFLKSAKFYRSCGKDEDSAGAMYGAYDAFLAAGMKSDANATADQLKKLYPSSRQAKNVRTDN